MELFSIRIQRTFQLVSTDNGITLCRECHVRLHKEQMKWEKKVF